MTTFKTYEPEARKPKSNEEDSLQATCFKHWNKYYRETSVLFSVPNGQKRNYHEAAVAVATGLTDGVSDLILCLPGAKTDFLEMKTATGTQKKGQKTFEANVRRLGFEYFLIRTFEQFEQHLTARLGPPNDSESNDQDNETAEEGRETGNEDPGRPEYPEAGIAAQETKPNGRRNQGVSSGIGRRGTVQTKVQPVAR